VEATTLRAVLHQDHRAAVQAVLVQGHTTAVRQVRAADRHQAEATTLRAVQAEAIRLLQAVAVHTQAATAAVRTQAVLLTAQVHHILAVHHHIQVQEGDKS